MITQKNNHKAIENTCKKKKNNEKKTREKNWVSMNLKKNKNKNWKSCKISLKNQATKFETISNWKMHWWRGCQLIVKPVKEKTSWT
jgi:hypothetical protein